MKHKRNSKILVFSFLTLSILNPISSGLAQGYIPDVTLTKPAEISKSGKIKFREDWVYKYDQGNMTPLGVKIAYDRFDSLGLKIEEANYDMMGNSLLQQCYQRNRSGIPIFLY